jgi:hypothetical protein
MSQMCARKKSNCNAFKLTWQTKENSEFSLLERGWNNFKLKKDGGEGIEKKSFNR